MLKRCSWMTGDPQEQPERGDGGLPQTEEKLHTNTLTPHAHRSFVEESRQVITFSKTLNHPTLVYSGVGCGVTIFCFMLLVFQVWWILFKSAQKVNLMLRKGISVQATGDVLFVIQLTLKICTLPEFRRATSGSWLPCASHLPGQGVHTYIRTQCQHDLLVPRYFNKVHTHTLLCNPSHTNVLQNGN